MATLRIQEILQEKGLSPRELSQGSGVSEEFIRALIEEPLNLTGDVATELKKISQSLNLTVIDLFHSRTQEEAVNLRILDLLQEKEMTIEDLSERAKVHPSFIGLFSTQSISRQNLENPQLKENLLKVSNALDISLDDLQVNTSLPATKLRLQETLNNVGLTFSEMGTLTDLPAEIIEFLATQPINISALNENNFFNPLCTFCPSCCLVAHPNNDA